MAIGNQFERHIFLTLIWQGRRHSMSPPHADSLPGIGAADPQPYICMYIYIYIDRTLLEATGRDQSPLGFTHGISNLETHVHLGNVFAPP